MILKYKLLISIVLFVSISSFTQTVLPVLHDSLFGTYYYQKVSTFRVLPQKCDEIVFVGNSITDSGEWSDIFNDISVSNMGISGDISAGVMHRVPDIVKRKPQKIFLMIGTNDLARNISPDSLIKNINLIAAYIKENAPETKLYIQSILPVNDHYNMFSGHTKNNAVIVKVNNILAENAQNFGYIYIDIHSKFLNINSKLRNDLSNDGLHLIGEGYQLWKHIIFPHMYDLHAKPSIIPKPQQLTWNDAFFPLYNCKNIFIQSDSIYSGANILKSKLSTWGWDLDISKFSELNTKLPFIVLKIEKVANSQREAYHIKIDENKISISANTKLGLFNGIQTILQLGRNRSTLDACEILDWPAFSWRGFMIDVGRNYVTPKRLKQLIDVMASYKLNVFHFHATEDIAWRIQVHQYPQLNLAEHMLRNKGMYYSTAEMKDLINYCKDRNIVFVPEIDMPGHSAAFKRAMKTDMQSDSGLTIVKNILKEFCNTYDVPFIHIGADEIKISNQKFIPEVTALIESYGKKVIGWQPGGNFNNNTIRQLWMENKELISADHNLELIDSRHLYLNHMDPLEAVTTLFYRRIGNKTSENKNLLGGTLCVWHDRAVSNEEDIFTMNPVYQGLLTFAERTWQGGGNEGWKANIGNPDEMQTEQFKAFENRMLDHKVQYFSKLPFNYTKQSDMIWYLYGPYDNQGDIHKKFEPEIEISKYGEKKSGLLQVGGTIIFRHWWAPLITGAISNPEDSTTWYASTKLWSEYDRREEFWIGFNNFSRSQAPETPPSQNWDYKGSKVWVNGIEIKAPDWKQSGHKVDLETPLVDESYEFRQPTLIQLKKGWNDILIKAPVGSFTPTSWQNPVKWMFTFVKVTACKP